MDSLTSRPKRQAVVVAAHPDGFVEIFANQNIDVRIVRIPVAHTRAGEILAEQCAELMLPRRYRDLWRRDHLRAVGTIPPLTAQAALASLVAKDCVAALSQFSEPVERVA